MIKVQSLRLRGLFASSLLALAACSGTPSNLVDVQTNNNEGTPLTEPTTAAAKPQDPQGQNPQGRDRAALIKKALEGARRSLDLRLFEDARNEAAYVLELDSTNQEARDIVVRCNQVLGNSTGLVNPPIEQAL
ncbi:MAG: hypothetical protein JNK15_25460, partial [Planctomycetes bacterium]|nr:hypothetical protein [Planctomycetota bacterium]